MLTDMALPTQEGFQGDEKGVIPVFYSDTKLLTFQSEQEGIPVSQQVDMVRIFQAGERDTTIQEVNSLHKRRWPAQWAAYAAGREQVASGTPLALLFPGAPEVVEDCRRQNIFTVQALANVPDSAGHALPFLVTWKKKAQDFLEANEKGKGFNQLEARLDSAEKEKQALADKLAALEAQLDALTAPAKKKD